MTREAATELFRIYQEMLTNVARHAHATHVEIRMRQANGSLELAVCDNGRGISVSDAERRTSLGILGMEERAKRIGGTLSIGPGPGRRDGGERCGSCLIGRENVKFLIVDDHTVVRRGIRQILVDAFEAL